MQRSVFDEPAVVAAFAEAGINPKHAATVRRFVLARLRETNSGGLATVGARAGQTEGLTRQSLGVYGRVCTEAHAPLSCTCVPACSGEALPTWDEVRQDEQAPRAGERVPVAAWGVLRDGGFSLLSTTVAEACTSSAGASTTAAPVPPLPRLSSFPPSDSASLAAQGTRRS